MKKIFAFIMFLAVSIVASAQTFTTNNLVVNGTLTGNGPNGVNHVQTYLNVAALRAVSCVPGLLYADQGYTTIADGGQGIYVCNGSDTTTPDNGVTVLASASTFRLYLQHTGTINIKQAGAKCDGSTNDATAINAVVSALTNGGVLYVPPSASGCVVGSAINLASRNGIIIKGASGSAINSTQSRLIFNFTGAGDGITATSSQGVTIEDMILVYTSASYTGNLVNFTGTSPSPTNRCRINRSMLGGSGSATANSLVNLQYALNCTIENSVFFSAANGILGQAAAGGTFSNTIKVINNDFSTMTGWSIRYLGQAWTIQGNSFEPCATTAACAIQTITAAPTQAIDIIGNWFGDSTTSTSGWITLQGTRGALIEGNIFSANLSSTGIAISLDAVNGIAILGNDANTINTAINVVSASSGVTIKGNDFSQTVGTVISGLSSITNGEYYGNNPNIASKALVATGFTVRPDGLTEQWGTGSTAAGGTVAISFSPACTASPYNITLTPVSAGNFTMAATSIGTSGFTANAATANTGAGVAMNFYWRALCI